MATNKRFTGRLSRRDFFKFGGGALLAGAGAAMLPGVAQKLLKPQAVLAADDGSADLFMTGTDTWISLPSTPGIPPFHPDNVAPPLPVAPTGSSAGRALTTYMFAFRNLRGMSQSQLDQQKGYGEYPAPLFWIDEYDGEPNNEFKVRLGNLGLQVRPDLIDEHTVHFHGLRNVIPFYDGEPNSSFGIPILGDFTYVYRIEEPGTYMYHCHVEEVEHIHLGMTGMVFVRPMQNGNTSLYPSGKYVYNDNDGSTGYDREFVMLLTEIWAEAHWAFSHVQLPEWSDFKPDFFLLNGRVYPDTIAPHGAYSEDPAISKNFLFPDYDSTTGHLIPTPGYEHLVNQPASSLVTCNAGERVLLRLANLGFLKQTMALSGIKMEIVGKDATPLRGRFGTGPDARYMTSSVAMDAGEAFEAIFTAPPYDAGTAINDELGRPHNKYLLYNRNYRSINKLDPSGFGGQMTEVRVYPNKVPEQTIPNTNPEPLV